MSNIDDRLKAYAAAKGPKGNNIAYWSKRAEAHSEIAPRASRKMELPTTGKKMEVRDTSMKPFEPRTINRKMVGKD